MKRLGYLSFAVVAGVVASLLTAPREKEKIERFHALIRTPVTPGEVLLEPCHLPKGVEPATRATFFTGTDFEFPVPSKESVVGFLLSCVAVVAMIYSFIWIMS